MSAARAIARGLGFSDRAVRRALSDPLLSEGTARALSLKGRREPEMRIEAVMASVVMADDGIAFDGRDGGAGPLGGAETAFVALAEALAAARPPGRGAQPLPRRTRPQGVRWAPLSDGVPHACDLYIGNRGHRVIGLVRRRRSGGCSGCTILPAI